MSEKLQSLFTMQWNNWFFCVAWMASSFDVVTKDVVVNIIYKTLYITGIYINLLILCWEVIQNGQNDQKLSSCTIGWWFIHFVADIVDSIADVIEANFIGIWVSSQLRRQAQTFQGSTIGAISRITTIDIVQIPQIDYLEKWFISIRSSIRRTLYEYNG